MPLMVKKFSGEIEPFSEDKLRRSLERAGADRSVQDQVLARVRKRVYNGILTRKIYQMARKELRSGGFNTVVRYDLKEALLRLGPAGYVFEKYIGRILEHKGYRIEMNRVVQGRCITHEIDVSAYKGKDKVLIECKHHERAYTQSHIQTCLYVQARFEDLTKSYNKVMLVTNTKFSRQAIEYARCAGVELLGWSYPAKMSLERFIDQKKLWPVTALPSVKGSILQHCFDNGIILLQDFLQPDIAHLERVLRAGVGKIQKIQDEVNVLMNG